MFLTHAHIDHSGLLPQLYKNGFSGTVYATPETCDLCRIMLRDSAHIQESEAEWRTRKAERSGQPAVEPLYTVDDVEGLLQHLRGVPYGRRIPVLEGVDAAFSDIGHLMGSACVELWLSENGAERKMVFSGDVGNLNQPIINDPLPVAEADYLVIESTYGDRLHDEERPDYVAELARYIQTTLGRGGNLVIPSFAVGRTQEMLYFIREIKNRRLVQGCGDFKVFVDSPLANEATGIFLQCGHDCLDPEARALVESGVNPLVFPGLETTVTSEESRAINFDPTPKVIIASGGMCEGGRIRHHLKHNLWRKESTILFVGYQAAGTLGRILVDGAPRVKLFGEDIAVNAEIAKLSSISGHADKNGLLAWMDQFQKKPHTVFVNHGEDQSCQSFARCLKEEKGYPTVIAPYSGTEYDLAADRMIRAAEGIPLRRKAPGAPALDPRGAGLLAGLQAALRRVTSLVNQFEGRPNRDVKGLTSDLDNLCNKWKK